MLNHYDKSKPLHDLEGWIVFYAQQAQRIENDAAMAEVFQASCETCDLLLELQKMRKAAPIVVNVTIEMVLSWRERLGQMSQWVFGRNGAHCSQVTYDELKHRCDEVRHSVPLPCFNGFNIHVKDGVPDGVLQKCDCK
jgi:hypothetical protein